MPANNVSYPIAPVTTSGSTYTVDYYLKNPRILARDVVDIMREGFWTSEVFDMGVRTEGGSITFEAAPSIATDLYLDRDIERVGPLTEAAIVTGARGDITTLPVEEWAGKYPIAGSARRRNDIRQFTRQQTQLANTFSRKFEIRGVEVLDAAISAASRAVDAPQPLSTINAVANSSKDDLDNVMAAYAIAQASADKEERGTVYNTAIISPDDKVKYGYAFGFGNVEAAFRDFGLRLITSNRVTTGNAYLVQAGAFGGFGWELDPTFRVDYDAKIRGDWVEGEAAFVPYVDNVYAAYKITTL